MKYTSIIPKVGQPLTWKRGLAHKQNKIYKIITRATKHIQYIYNSNKEVRAN